MKIKTKRENPNKLTLHKFHRGKLRYTWINNMKTQTYSSNLAMWQTHRRREIWERHTQTKTHTHTHIPSFPARGCIMGLGVLLLWIRVTGFDLLLDQTCLRLVLFCMKAMLEQTSPCAALLKNPPFPFLHLFTPSAVYHLLQQTLCHLFSFTPISHCFSFDYSLFFPSSPLSDLPLFHCSLETFFRL